MIGECTSIIKFNTNGYDGFIDFIKAYAILCVLFGHTFGPVLPKLGYAIWAGMQVPLFILIQAFHFYKKDDSILDIHKTLKRILLPFFIVEVCTFFISWLINGDSRNDLIVKLIDGGGYGPGSYFPWVFLQVSFLLPVFGSIFTKCNRLSVVLIMLTLCESIEVFFSLINLSTDIYRLICTRYILLFFFGWLWAKEGIKINGLTIILSCISLAFVLYFAYFSNNDEPWFFAGGFKFHKWPCYYWVAFGLTAILHVIWNKIKNIPRIVIIIKKLASSSYEIFLLQMSLIYLFKFQSLTFISNKIVQYSLWLILVWSISVIGGIVINKNVTKILKRK